jgi:ABC-2 type transport system ATP-binding protein
VVIGKGKLIAQSSTEDFVNRATENTVVVRSPQLQVIRAAIEGTATHLKEDGNKLIVSGMDSEKIGEIAAANGAVLHELSQQRGSLEEAFIQLTGDSVEYHADLGQNPDLVTTGK